MSMHFSLIEMHQKPNENITTYLQHGKVYSDELVAVGKALDPSYFNIYLFKGICSKFKDFVTTLTIQIELVSFTKLHSLLLNHELPIGKFLSTFLFGKTMIPRPSIQQLTLPDPLHPNIQFLINIFLCHHLFYIYCTTCPMVKSSRSTLHP